MLASRHASRSSSATDDGAGGRETDHGRCPANERRRRRGAADRCSTGSGCQADRCRRDRGPGGRHGEYSHRAPTRR